FSNAEKAYRSALDLKRGLTGAQIGLARTLLIRGQREEATKLLDEARRQSPENPQVRVVRSAILSAEGKVDAAIKELEEPPPSARSPQAMISLADLYTRAGRFDEAINLLTKVTKALPNALVAHHLLGQVALRAGRPALAVSEFTEVVKQVPQNPFARLSLAT